MDRDYQFNYSEIRPSVYDDEGRSRKANTIVKVCQDFLRNENLSHLSLLDVGASSGIIDNYLADYFGKVAGIDIDEPALMYAQRQFDKPNLRFAVGDAMALSEADNSLDVVVCSHVYEHVPDAGILFHEIHRVLRPGGFCYFSGNNRLMFMEPHYRLPLLSLLPQSLANSYMRITGRGTHYHEKHLSFRELKELCSSFRIHDYSPKVIQNPEQYGVEYMLRKGTLKRKLAKLVSQHLKFAAPHIWVLEKTE